MANICGRVAVLCRKGGVELDDGWDAGTWRGRDCVGEVRGLVRIEWSFGREFEAESAAWRSVMGLDWWGCR